MTRTSEISVELLAEMDTCGAGVCRIAAGSDGRDADKHARMMDTARGSEYPNLLRVHFGGFGTLHIARLESLHIGSVTQCRVPCLSG